jgi:shikimate dehydrogenase
MNWAYIACHVEPANLRSALTGIRDMNFRGINLTVPHKILALDIVDEADAEARQLGAVNTVSVKDGRLLGHNTDGYGFTKAIQEDFNLTLAGKRVVILGAGGAGRALAIQCVVEGAAKVIVANRTPGKTAGITCDSIALEPAVVAAALRDADLLVNATSVGLRAGDSLGLPVSAFHRKLCVYDTIYRPAETDLLRQAAVAGSRVCNGLSMLLHQGARAFEIWTGRKAPLPVMRRALRAAVYGEPG